MIKNHKPLLRQFALGLFFLVVTAFRGAAAPQAELWDLWTVSSEGSQIQVDHSPWAGILGRYLDTGHPSGISRFAYNRVTPADKAVLAGYIESLEQVEVTNLGRKEQMAYWINFYNALTVTVILDAQPVKSIRDISLGGGGPLGRGPWDAPLVTIMNQPVSLNDMEHRILRPIWKDPRIHYAVNCASLGCPNLQPLPFTAANTENLLESAARSYINHPRGVDVSGKTLTLSSIYDWFGTDFGTSKTEILNHIYVYAEPDLRRLMEPFRNGEGKIRYQYDWNINN